MMGFFKSHNPKKSISANSINSDDLTSLDPPQLSHLPSLHHSERKHDSFASQLSQMNIVTERNCQTFQSNATKQSLVQQQNQQSQPQPQDNEFAVKNMTLVSNGLKGEQERNMILEQQVRMLSHQAAMALDRLSESNKENELLKEENEKLKKRSIHDTNGFKQRFSFGRRQSSTYSSTSSNGGNSVFSHTRAYHTGPGSKNSSISSIQTNIDQLKNSNNTFLEEINTSHEKEINVLKSDLTKLKQELSQQNSEMALLQDQMENLQDHIDFLKKENSSLLSKLKLTKQQSSIEIDHYNKQLDILKSQLSSNKSRTMDLSKKLELYNQSRLGIDNTRKILSL